MVRSPTHGGARRPDTGAVPARATRALPAGAPRRSALVYDCGRGRDTITGFDAAHDRIDLRAYGLTYAALTRRIIDRRWATEINLGGLPPSGEGDKILLKSVRPGDLDETNFIL